MTSEMTLKKCKTPSNNYCGVISLGENFRREKCPSVFLFCVNAGWDTDTTAAIAGNTSGAWNGRQGIPKRWVDNLERGYKGRNYIITLAQCLFDHQSRIKPMNVFLEYLTDWWRNVGFIFNMLTRKPMR